MTVSAVHPVWRRSSPITDLRGHLEALARSARLRALAPRQGIDFASNDYLGLSRSPLLRQAVHEALHRGAAIGSGGSRLLRGNDPEHELLECDAADFFGTETALYFSSGYAANLAVFGAVPQRGDLVVYDELIHASAHDGMRLGRAQTVAARHNDPNAFADAAEAWRRQGGTGRIWLAVESLYSMDGDQAPIDDLERVAERFEAALVVDEAHATGVLGPNGKGLTEALHGRSHVITLHTCGKAMGCEGAIVCGAAPLGDFLVNRARSFIFSTAPSPLMAAAARAALRELSDRPHLRQQLWQRVAHAKLALSACGVTPRDSQILPLILGDDARTMAIASALQDQGFDVRGIRPPTVPVGTSRLRISLTLNASFDDIDALAGALRGLV